MILWVIESARVKDRIKGIDFLIVKGSSWLRKSGKITSENVSSSSMQVSPTGEILTLKMKCYGFESQELHLILEV